MQKLRNSPDLPAIPAVQSGLCPLRRAADSVPGSFTNSRQRVSTAPSSHAGSVVETRPQRGANSGAGERPAAHCADPASVTSWPGRGHGVRQPHPSETTLSWGEVMHGVRLGLIGWGWK